MESEEAKDLAKLRALFPDYHSGFRDIVVDTTARNDDVDEASADKTNDGIGEVDARAKALGHMSDRQLASVVAGHCRIFLSLSARRLEDVRVLLERPLLTAFNSHTRRGVGSNTGGACTDAERLVAFGDSYRASVLLAESTSRLSSCAVRSNHTAGGGKIVSPLVLDMEEAFAGSHTLALANAARLCNSGRTLLEDAAVGSSGDEACSVGSKKKKVSDAGWFGEGAAGRNLLFVDPLINFQLDANIHETRLADVPLVSVLRRVAGLLEEFPGHGVLIQVCHFRS